MVTGFYQSIRLNYRPVVGNMPGQSSGSLKKVRWQFPGNAVPGMYRLVFGQTVYARVMNEAPQQLDFIFNNENIILETNFTAPQDSLLVVLSEENRVWFGFSQRRKKASGDVGYGRVGTGLFSGKDCYSKSIT
jgi:hypothetical protein